MFRLVSMGFRWLVIFDTEDLVGFETKTVNLRMKIVVSGFIDSHVHLISGGLQVCQ
ncbi:hypothetical protein ACS0TY_018972 [Phlomoides rotata]